MTCGACTRQLGGAGIGSERASWTSTVPIRCPMAGTFGWTGRGRWRLTTLRRSKLLKLIAAPRLYSPRWSPQWSGEVNRSHRVLTSAVHEEAFAPARGLMIRELQLL